MSARAMQELAWKQFLAAMQRAFDMPSKAESKRAQDVAARRYRYQLTLAERL